MTTTLGSPEAFIGATPSAEIAANSIAQRSALMNTITPTGGMMEATKTVGAVAPSIAGTIVSTGLLLGALFFVFKGVQMVVTGKNAFKKTV